MCDDGIDRTGWPQTQFDDEDGAVVRRAAQELEHKARLARAFGLGLVAIGVLALVTLAGATLYQGAQVRGLVKRAVVEAEGRNREQAEGAVLLGNIMTCILGQFAEHRDASRADHQDLARLAGARSPLTHGGTPGPPEYNHETVTKACEATTATLNSGQDNPLDPLRKHPGGP